MIKGLYKTDVVTITPEKSVKEACTLMRDRGVGDVVVVDQKKPVGMLTDRDIVTTCLAEGKTDIETMKVGDVMSRNLVFIAQDAGLFETIRRMREAGVGRILVIDENEMLQGILTATTIFDLLNEELHELGLIARSRRSAARRTTEATEPIATLKSDNVRH